MNSNLVSVKDAARELNMSVINVRELMKSDKLNIGYVIQRGKRPHFLIYRHLLDVEKARLGLS